MKTASRAKTLTFRAKLVRVGPFYGVELPAAVSQAIGRRGWVPVVGRVNGVAEIRTSLMPKAVGRHILIVGREARTEVGARLGATLTLELRVDASRLTERERKAPLARVELPIPEDLAEALREEGVLEDWGALPPGRRAMLVRYIEDAAQDATRAKRVGRAVQEAHARREKRIDRGMC